MYRLRSSLRASPSFRVLPSNTYPTAAAIRSSHGLCFPTAHRRVRGPLSRAMQAARYGPPSGFDYPLGGLLPRTPGRFCFAPAALLGFALRRFHLPERITGLSTVKNPRTVSRPFFSAPKCRLGPTSLGFWVHASRECLATDQGFSPTITGASLGIHPSRAVNESLDSDFSESPLTRFAGSGDYSPNPSAPQSLDQPSSRFARRQYRSTATGRSCPYGLLAPACS